LSLLKAQGTSVVMLPIPSHGYLVADRLKAETYPAFQKFQLPAGKTLLRDAFSKTLNNIT